MNPKIENLEIGNILNNNGINFYLDKNMKEILKNFTL